MIWQAARFLELSTVTQPLGPTQSKWLGSTLSLGIQYKQISQRKIDLSNAIKLWWSVQLGSRGDRPHIFTGLKLLNIEFSSPLTTFPSLLLLLSLSFWVAPNLQDSNTYMYTRWWWELEHQWYTCATVQPYSNNSPIKIIMMVVRKIYFYSTTFGHINASSPSHSKLSENSILSTVQLKPLSIHNLWLVFEVLLFEVGLSLTGVTFRDLTNGGLRNPSSQ